MHRACSVASIRALGTPAAALVVNALIGVAAILSGRTSQLIVLSVLGALTLYAMSMAALFMLRRREPRVPRPYRTIGYPLFPAVALVLSVVSIAAVVWSNLGVAGVFAGILVVAAVYWRFLGTR